VTGLGGFTRVMRVLVAGVLIMLGLPLAAWADPSDSPAPGSSGTSTQPAAKQPTPVTVTLLSITPRSPDANKPDQPVTFTATVTNTSDVNYSDVEVYLERGFPLFSQASLEGAVATPPPTDTIQPKPVDVGRPLPAHRSLTVTYRSTPGSEDMCLCDTAVYPYALVVQGLQPGIGFAEIGRTQILVPSFSQIHPKPVAVSWIWPLIEPPHRSASETVFNDDKLAQSVSSGGRLDRALRVVEGVTNHVRLTIPIDPDLLDSLAVMAGPSGYQVKTASGVTAGTGGEAAHEWLERLSAVRTRHDIVLTAYADPDIDAVSRAGLKWSTALDPQVKTRIAPYLDDFTSDLTWPADGIISGKALDAAVGGGASAVLLSDAALPGKNKSDPPPDAVSPLPTATGVATALVTDSALQKLTARTLAEDTNIATDLQTLLSELAVRAVTAPAAPHLVVIAASRYIDPSPANAIATLLSSSTQTWSQSVGRRTAIADFTPVDRGSLVVPADAQSAEVPSAAMDAVLRTQQQVTSLRGALDNAAALTLLGGFNSGIQRAQSSAWRTVPAEASTRAAELNMAIDTLTSKVHLVEPTTPNYSLSSSNSPLVVTVANGLNEPVKVRVQVVAGRGNSQGFSADEIGVQTVPANSRIKVSIPTHINRVSRIQVLASLTAPDGGQLGQQLNLNVRSTALGGITKIVTFGAAAVLILALLIRLIRRIRRGYASHSLATVGAQ